MEVIILLGVVVLLVICFRASPPTKGFEETEAYYQYLRETVAVAERYYQRKLTFFEQRLLRRQCKLTWQYAAEESKREQDAFNAQVEACKRSGN